MATNKETSKSFNIQVQQNREVINGFTVSRSITLTIGDAEPITLTNTELRELHQVIEDIRDMENNYQDSMERRDEEARNYADTIN